MSVTHTWVHKVLASPPTQENKNLKIVQIWDKHERTCVILCCEAINKNIDF